MALFNQYPSLDEEEIKTLVENVREREREYEGENTMFRLMMQTGNMLRGYADDGSSALPRARIFAERMVQQNEEVEQKIQNHNRYISLIAWRDFDRNIGIYIQKYAESRAERLNPDSWSFWNDSLPWYPPYPQTTEEFVDLYTANMVKWFGHRPQNIAESIVEMERQNTSYRGGKIDGISIYRYFGML